MLRIRHSCLPLALLAFSLASVRLQGQAPPEAGQWPLRPEIERAASLPGEPAIVSSGGITRAETELVTLENPDAFASSAKRRVVLVGGFGANHRAAEAVIAAATWMKNGAPAAVKQAWVASAMPLADPDGTAKGQPFTFPPAKGFFDDPQQPESRYVWRWTTYQAPDLVVVVKDGDDASADALARALVAGESDGPGTVPAVAIDAGSLVRKLPNVLAAHVATSPLHATLVTRASRDPLTVARTLARKYPQQVVSSYIPSVAWTNMLRLSEITGEPEWRAKVYEQTAPWTSGEKTPIAVGARTPLTSIAGYMIFAELAGSDRPERQAAHRLAEDGAAMAGALKSPGEYANGSGWTDDMFMATAVLARVSRLPDESGEHNAGKLELAARLLGEYASRLQRPDGIFSHAVDGPVAWGRGNGFAAFGSMEALTAMAPADPARQKILDIFRRQMTAIRAQQAPDGMFRQVIDEPGSYREETATAMLLSAMSRAVRLGWLDRSFAPVGGRAWRALAAHVADDASLVDVCTGTGSGPTRRYYLDRPAIDGFDDRGGAMALLASIETYELAHHP